MQFACFKIDYATSLSFLLYSVSLVLIKTHLHDGLHRDGQPAFLVALIHVECSEAPFRVYHVTLTLSLFSLSLSYLEPPFGLSLLRHLCVRAELPRNSCV